MPSPPRYLNPLRRRRTPDARRAVSARLVSTRYYACLHCAGTTANRGRVCTPCLRQAERLFSRP